MTDERDAIDLLVRNAAEAHEALAPAGRVDSLAERVLARLASGSDREASMTSDTDNDSERERGPSPRADGGTSEDSGLHDIRALAVTAKHRISRRITTQNPVIDDSLSSSHSGLRAVALPAPAQIVSLPDLPGAKTATGTGAAAAVADGPIPDVHAAKSHVRLYATMGGVLLAAAAVLVVVMSTSGSKKKSDDRVAQAEQSRGTGAAMGSAPEAEKLAAPGEGAMTAAPHAATDTGASGGATATVVAMGSGSAAASGSGSDTRSDSGEAAGSAADGQGVRDPLAAGPGGQGKKESGVLNDKGKPDKTDRAKDPNKDKAAPGTGSGSANGAGAGSGSGSAAKGSDKGGKGKDDGKNTGGDKSLDQLLDEASGGPVDHGGGGGGGDGDKPKPPEKTGLDGNDIKKAMGAVAGRAQACYDQYNVAGHVLVKATVDPSGHVTKASAGGEFAGTPTGSCVAAAAQGASFPSWTGAPMTVTYAFTLQE